MSAPAPSSERGQALLGVVLSVLLTGLAWEALVVAWQTSDARLSLQNGLDAGTTTGAAVLADGLNTLAVTNVGLLALGIPSILGWGEGVQLVRELQHFQDQVVARTPGLARSAAWAAATAQGAGLVDLSSDGRARPSLMVRRVYLLPWLFGSTFPLWIADDFRPGGDNRWGKRVLRLRGLRISRRGAVVLPLRTESAAAATFPGSRRSALPMLEPGFESRLIPVPGTRP